ncbi:DUF1326 domain-containing protein [Phytoactinopolyspora endophytica]|uniref:DUF1326 domain-containing protein n=1 Tax=Phytoactinopolyspora endophytica TaxID=1642495 RepID=UPI0013EAEAE5|nr:DUF1326 domain-containing protein [Phytoactinopolyspora endophytica]
MSNNVQWSLSGDYLEACSCDYGCPCKFGATPTQGYCQGVIGFDIRDGSHGDVDLSGLGFAGIIHAPGAPWEGNITGTFYIDETATLPQRESLTTILSGQAGGFWALISTLVSENKGVKFAPTQMETEGARRTFTIPGVVELVNEPLLNPMTQENQEVMVQNSFDPFCVSGRAGRSTKAVNSDPDLSFDVSGRQGYIGAFTWTGP